MSTPTYYSPDNTTLLVGGVTITGFAADTAIVVTRTNGQNIIPTAGVDGSVALAVNKDRLGMMTIHLKNTSEANQYLVYWQYLLDASEGSIVPFFPVVLHNSDTNLSIGTWGWIENQPDYTLGQEIGTLEWGIGLADATLDNLTVTVASSIAAATIS